MSKLELPITPGVYRTRGGQRAIAEHLMSGLQCVRGKIEGLQGQCRYTSWDSNGAWITDNASPHDLIERIGDLPVVDPELLAQRLADDASDVPESVPPTKTLLDEFAGLAMQAALVEATIPPDSWDKVTPFISEFAYKMASAMLRERAKHIK